MAAADVVQTYLDELPGDSRRVAPGEWGVSVAAEAAAGWPLDIGLRLSDGLLRAKAFAAPAQEQVSPWVLLSWNRQTRFVRFGSTRDGDIWVHGDLAASEISGPALDRLLGLVVQELWLSGTTRAPPELRRDRPRPQAARIRSRYAR